MRIEKRNEQTVWYSYGEYAFKASRLASGNIAVWVNYKGCNIAFPMIIRELLDNMEEYNNFNVTVNRDWNEHIGFEVNQDEVELLIGEILHFCTENDPVSMDLTEKYTDEEWYT
ncbi:hypothetical protein [Lysinibacillus odysseyi]|uniref:Uncharacterized protein n=1 Tax=Lysinibacillus odysseyi 34hs-1 = NBRC 100172 TaxID=1220589 RepID=A0A0A3IGR0_9BACI|nr:hypothetical protein [Lysinibacillus odysseyi]KGR83951.1 hypothetical protein CD32_14785 [Lysinibacillus odysseyi 34hs-1 = NBRC 100172]